MGHFHLSGEPQDSVPVTHGDSDSGLHNLIFNGQAELEVQQSTQAEPGPGRPAGTLTMAAAPWHT